MRHQPALGAVVVVAVGPLVHAHLRGLQIHAIRQPVCHGLALAVLVDRNGGLVTVLDSPDDVLGTEGRIAAKENTGPGGLEGFLADLRHVPLVELDTQVALDPGKSVLLADGDDDVVGREHLFAEDAFCRDPAAGVDIVFHDIEEHAPELAALGDKGLRGAVDDDLHLLFFRIIQLPGGSLEKLPGLSRHHLDAFGAQAQ